MPDVVFVLPCPLEPLLDDKLPHLAGPEVGEAGEVEEGEAVVYPLQVEDDETRLLPEGILGDVREGAAELRLVVSEECEVVVSSLVLLRGPSSSSSQVIRKDSILVIFQRIVIISGTEWKFPF